MSLPPSKKSALADKVAQDVHRELTKHYRDLRSHEVSKEDARDIIDGGTTRGKNHVNDDIAKDK